LQQILLSFRIKMFMVFQIMKRTFQGGVEVFFSTPQKISEQKVLMNLGVSKGPVRRHVEEGKL
jgi:hypothetical protein